MHQFTVNKTKAEALVKANAKKMLPVLIIACVIGGSLPVYNSSQSGKEVLLPILIIIPVIAVTLFFSVRRGIRRNIKSLETYVLTIGDTEITRQQQNLPPLTIKHSDITVIMKKPNGSFFIKGKNRWTAIFIPAPIEKADELEILLNDIHPITTQHVDKATKLQVLLMLLPAICFAIIIIAKNKIMVGVAGSIGILLLVYSFYAVMKSKNVDNRSKRGAWWSLLVLASMVYIIYYKLKM